VNVEFIDTFSDVGCEDFCGTFYDSDEDDAKPCFIKTILGWFGLGF